MEFFDFTGTNEEEKAQALDIIAHRGTSGVEFFLNYNPSTSTRLNYSDCSHDEVSSKSYLHLNGNLHNEQHRLSSISSSSSGTSSSSSNNNLDHHRNQNDHNTNSIQAINIENRIPQHQSSIRNDPNYDWEPKELPMRNAVPTNHLAAIRASGRTARAHPPPPTYLLSHGHSIHPYFAVHAGPGTAASLPTTAPPSNPYAIHPIHPHQPPPLAQPSHHQHHHHHQSKHIVMPSVMTGNLVPSSSSTKNTSLLKNTTVNSSSCDMNSTSLYMPPTQYSDASLTNLPIVENNRIKGSSIAVSGDNCNQMIGDSMVSNGSNLTPVPPQCLSAYASFAFHQTHALPFPPPGHFSQPIYYLPQESFIQFTPFSPTNAPAAHISIPNHASFAGSTPQPIVPHPHDVISPSMDIIVPSETIPSSNSIHSSTATNINSNSISSPASEAYQSSGTDATFYDETNIIEENRTDSKQNTESNFSEKENDSFKLPELKAKVPSEQSLEHKVPENSEANEVNEQVESVQEYLKMCLNISEKTNDTEQKHSTVIEKKDQIDLNNVDDDRSKDESSKANVVDDETLSESSTDKPKTWASKLFPATNNQNSFSSSLKSQSNKHNVNHDVSNNDNPNDILNDSFVETSDIINGKHRTVSPNSNSHIFFSKRFRNPNGHQYRDQNSDAIKKLSIVPLQKDPIAHKLARRLRDTIHLKHSLPTIIPSGLINRGNWCYVNAILQALLACPPFYNLMREISETSGLFRQSTSTPIIDNFARFFSKFIPIEQKRNLKSGNNPYLEELLNSDPFEPLFIYDTLKHIGMIQNDAQRGHQEDAEEFLSSVLNGLHEEMIKLAKYLDEIDRSNLIHAKTNGSTSDKPSVSEIDSDFESNNRNPNDVNNEDENESNDLWHEVGTSKHKSLPTRSTKTFSTLITEIFGGSTLDIRTIDKDASGNRQPFFTMQLDIKHELTKSIEDAIRYQTKSEVIYGYICPKTKQAMDASNQRFLEILPPILIFHLKLFDYDIETGVTKKLLKSIEFGENLEIPRECLSSKIGNRCRRFKLLAVVYHNGTEVVNGHYLTDVYHLGLNQWLRCDDSTIKLISLSKVLESSDRENGNLVPYLIFYRRYDTLHHNNNSNQSMSASFSNININNSNNSMKSSRSNTNTAANNGYGGHHHYSHNSNEQDQTQDGIFVSTTKFNSISRQL
ncbi:Ubiquitin carboxyl-terminal hydrolase 10 [Sarcoptes scabiei]|uniref:ubiquitinyl hydrolase 1 n=1 Tax=Sarcoptes scabiei TaxID=52283 RepID=A0A834R787_SARSC|nr:Ubiquitin carboxyl-terminal hydrolase 10 [Sarcoptes scabiei]